jgi:WD40 repeat protein
MLSSGDSSGVVKVWNLKKGKKLKEFQISKKKPVTTISFGI